MPVVNVNLTDTFDQWRVKTNTISNSFGDLVLLSTDVKTDLVSAVNEIKLVADTAEANVSSKLENVVEDITPELGGDLSLNSRNLIGTGNINITGNIDATGVITGTIIVGGDLSGTTNNAQINPNAVGINELNVVDGIAGQALFTDGNGNLSFNNVVTDPTLGGDLSGTTSNAQINVNAVDGTHIAIGGDTAGDILYYNGIDYTRLAAGTAGQALVMNSGATAPEWGVSASGQEFVEDTFVADGIADTFSPLSQVAVSEESLLVFIDGVAQPSTAFTLPTETSITFSSPPPQNSNIRVLHLGTPIPVANVEIADGSVTDDKIVSVSSSKITGGIAYDISFLAGFDGELLPTDLVVQKYGEMIMGRTGVFDGEVGAVETASIGADIICDVELNGTTIYSTKPTFSASSTSMTSGTLNTTGFSSGDKLTFKVTQIGSDPDFGKGLRFMLKCRV